MPLTPEQQQSLDNPRRGRKPTYTPEERAVRIKEQSKQNDLKRKEQLHFFRANDEVHAILEQYIAATGKTRSRILHEAVLEYKNQNPLPK